MRDDGRDEAVKGKKGVMRENGDWAGRGEWGHEEKMEL